MKKLLLFVFVICQLVFSSCSMQKRLYTKGFYTHIAKTIKKQEVIAENSKLKIKDLKIKTQDSKLIASNAKNIESLTLTFKPTDACDTIILKSGAKLTVSIKDANSTDIKYRTCPTSNGLYLSIKRADVSGINFGNGRKEVFEEEHKYNQPSNLPDDKFAQYNGNGDRKRRNENNGKKTNSFGIMGLVTSFIPLQIGLIFAVLNIIGVISLNGGGIAAVPSAWFIIPLLLAFISFILCLIAIIQIAKNKETQKGLGMAVLGLILSLFIIIALLALMMTA